MRAIFLLSASLLAPLAAATAQPSQAPEGGRDPARFEQRMAQHRAERAQDIATVLALKPAQKPALDTWLASMTPPPHEWHKGPPTAEGAARTTDQMLQHKQQRLAERQQRETAMIDSTRRFYASLDPQQKTVFDALERLRHDDGGHHGHGGHRGPGGDMPPPPAQGE